VRAKSIWAVVMRGTLRFGSAILISVITTATANAQSVHYAPGAFNIRDFALPGPGLYGAIYNYGYLTSDLKGVNGNQISSVTITGPGGRLSTTLNVNVNVNL